MILFSIHTNLTATLHLHMKCIDKIYFKRSACEYEKVGIQVSARNLIVRLYHLSVLSILYFLNPEIN